MTYLMHNKLWHCVDTGEVLGLVANCDQPNKQWKGSSKLLERLPLLWCQKCTIHTYSNSNKYMSQWRVHFHCAASIQARIYDFSNLDTCQRGSL